MLLGTVQICGEKLSQVEVDDICCSMDSNSIRLLSLRDCKVRNQDFKNMMTSLSHTKHIAQLNLNLGMVSSIERVQHLSGALMKNRSLTHLYLHGSPLGDDGAAMLCRGLALHPNVIYLDLGDCLLSDVSIVQLTGLLPPNGAKRGLHELTLSANPGVSTKGWTKFFIAMSSSSTLKTLNLDYNTIGDYGVGCLAVVLASNDTMKVLDLEGTGTTEFGAQALLYLVKNYPVSIKQIILAENKIKESTKKAIQNCLKENNHTASVCDDDHSKPMELNSTGGSNYSSSPPNEMEENDHNPLASNTNYWSVLGDTGESTAWETPRQTLSSPKRLAGGIERVTPALLSQATRKSIEKQIAKNSMKLSKTAIEELESETESESGSDSEPEENRENRQRGQEELDTTSREATGNTSSSYAKNSDSRSTREAVHEAYRAALMRKDQSSNS